MNTDQSSIRKIRVTDYLALAIATCGVGYLPLAPGTFGSLVAVGIFLLLARAIAGPSLLGVVLLAIAIITCAGIWAGNWSGAFGVGGRNTGHLLGAGGNWPGNCCGAAGNWPGNWPGAAGSDGPASTLPGAAGAGM